jgi:hypothetical protein
MALARRGIEPPPAALASWLDRHGVLSADRAAALASLRSAFRKLSLKPRAVVVYFNAQGSAWGRELAAYMDEWRVAPFGDREGDDERSVGELPVVPRESYQDYVLWHLDRVLATGAADGVYFDNTFLRATFDDYLGPAYRDERGDLHPGVDIYALRQLLRRAQTLVWQRRRGWWTVAHLSTTPISAIHGFAGIALDGEWKYGDAPFPTRFPRDLMRASALGAQTGTVPTWLPGILNVPEPRRSLLRRQLLGFATLHELRVMDTMTDASKDWWEILRAAGYGRADCAVRHYWETPAKVEVAGVDAELLTIHCPRRITAVVVNFGAGGVAKLRVRGSRGIAACRDVEKRGAIEGVEGGCQFTLGAYEVRVVELRARGGV